YWTCGMHPSVKQDQEGKCPICNMDLVPVYAEAEKEAGHAEETGDGREILYWTCGMHPSVKQDQEGKCPICNMDLVPVYVEREKGAGKQDEIRIAISPAAARLARISTVEVSRRNLVKLVRAPALVEYDETGESVISARVGGRVEKLYADYTGMTISGGDPLALLYSPELISAQKEFLLASGSDMSGSARRKLLLWGITEQQIEELSERGDVQETLLIHASSSGTLVHSYIREGSYVREGDPLFHIADLSTVWVMADLFENDMNLIQEGLTAEIEFEALPGESIKGRISFMEPFLSGSLRSLKVRVEVDNRDNLLKPGMLAAMNIEVPLRGSKGMAASTADHSEHSGHAAGVDNSGMGVLAVPKSAVVNTGTRSVAFVQEREGVYLLRNVTLGSSSDGYYVILDGLAEGERVVEKGSFLIDSQSRLTGQAEEVYGGALGKESESDGHRH
ncbi:MAG: HlyD family efflux transporter periplasmic adaptor subunit, partial [Candidatus Latescibacteria bacterium]|nr:HlyD family efflux transporter periplasmic adaptor subunit [bacterium]MBD3425268.1 HlyD family efflux transporter periplasmic adaptor subunit [Candidatus Latescibacterota bacterium]